MMDPRSSAPRAFVSVILCTQGTSAEFGRTLESLQGVEVPDDLRAELVVVENGPPGNTRSLVEAFHHPRMTARYFHEPEPGKSGALNRALREAGGDIFLFSDDDIRFPTDWLRGMCAPILAGAADAVAGAVKLAPHLLRPWMNHTHRAWLASTADYIRLDGPSEMCGANMAYHRRVLDKVPAYDPELGPGIGNGEETLFSWQLREAGFKVVALPDVEVIHHLNAERLRYTHWTRTALLNGQARAYLAYHWQHRRIAVFPRLMAWLIAAKLRLRRLFSKRYRPDEEGISPWELDYRWELSQCVSFLQEKRRPRKYPLKGLVKLSSHVPPAP